MVRSSSDADPKGRPSFRDRLKWPTSKAVPATPEPSQNEEAPQKRAAYRPKHAASDFSRLGAKAVPLRITGQEADNGMLPNPPSQTVPPDSAVRSSGLTVQPQDIRASPASSSRFERRPSPANLGIARTSEDLHPVRSRSSAGRKSQSSADTNLATAQAALSVPINKAPVVWNLDLKGIDLKPPSHPEQHQPTDPQDLDFPLASASTSSPPSNTAATPSDFELFLADAEAQERRQREDVWNTITAAARASGATTGTSPPAIPPSPHQQFVVNAGIPRPRGLPHAGSSHLPNPEMTPRAVKQARLSRKASMECMNGGETSEKGDKERALRKEASIAQKIAEYIKPPRAGGVLYDSGDRENVKRWAGSDVRLGR
ncbi:hypothetical protein QBC34DRAFT_479451 [Podospora aff. communis PSN243]|uniref:Uncharacterized protein n=1 Tax=Podospora aff. communis PSN243 TaxID=3040156 RepID=A0AAV9G0W4_9PEZI|nr:hypothetical protein QBC34DRAFT_479451 [Podospora aff. communis PSN243]